MAPCWELGRKQSSVGLSRAAQAASPQGKGRKAPLQPLFVQRLAKDKEQQLYTALDHGRLLWPVGAIAMAQQGPIQALLLLPLLAASLARGWTRSCEKLSISANVPGVFGGDTS